MKKLLLLFVAVLFTATAHAYDLENNGIYYNKKSDGSLEVVGSSTTNVDIPSSFTIASVKYRVTSIGSYAFNGRSDITYLSIPYSIKSIGEFAFMGCGSNITVNIAEPESWCKMQLGNEHASPLSSAKKMLVHDIETTSFSVPETVTSIGAYTFYQCSCLKTLYIPGSVTSIGSSAFEDCDYLTSLTLSNGLNSIGGSSFEGCVRLKTLSIPSTVTKIKINAFKRCTAITDVYCYATSVPTTDYYSFDKTPTGSATLHVPYNSISAYSSTWPWSDFKNVVSIETVSTGFEYGGIYYYIIDGKSVGVSSQPYVGDMVIPSTVSYNGKTYTVTTIPADQSDGNEPYTQLTSLVIPNTVTTIGKEAFGPCFKLKSLTIGSGVQSIGWGAFRGCTSLKTVVSKIQKPFAIPDVFLNLPSDAELIVPKGTKGAYQSTAGWKAFSKISEAIDSYDLLDDKGFYYKLKGDGTLEVVGFGSGTTANILSSVTISGQKYRVTSIGERAFEGRSDLTSLNLNEGLETIGGSAFEGCKKLTTLSIPSTVTKININAFKDCTSLNNITSEIQQPFTIDENVFSTYSTATLNVPAGTKSAYQSTAGWKRFQNIVEPNLIGQKIKINGFYYKIGDDNTVSVTSGDDANYFGDLVIPSQVKYGVTTYSVTSIEKNAFHRNSAITSVIIPNSVTSIGESAFGACTQLSTVSIPNSVTEMGPAAFYGCTALNEINFPSGLNRIENNLFWGCTSLTSFTIPEWVTSIAEEAFRECSNLSSIIIPNSVTEIGNRAFEDCSSLKYITSDIQNPFTISDDVFNGISSDAVLSVPVGTKSAYQSTAGWKRFYNIVEPAQIGQTIEINGFYFKIGDDNTASVISGDDANYFGDLVIPTHVTYDGTIYSVTSIEKDAFLRNSAIISVKIPNSVTSIGESAFEACTGLTSITIPNSVTEIGSAAFEGCTNLKLIIIGSSVASIGSRAFADINGELNSRSRAENNILKVICKAETLPETASDAFENSQIEQALLIVPDDAVVDYQTAAPWNKFGTISGETEYLNIDTIIFDSVEESIYDLQGNRLANLHKGVNIIKNVHGKVRKVFVR